MPNDMVNVLVPRAYVPLVRGFLAGLDAHGALEEQPVSTSQPAASVEGQECAADDWTAAKLNRLVRESHSGNMRTILTFLASHPDEWVSTHALAEAIGDGADSSTVAGALGAFGRRCYNRYAMDSLPFEGHWDHEHACKMHRMSAKVASDVLRSLAELQGESSR